MHGYVTRTSPIRQRSTLAACLTTALGAMLLLGSCASHPIRSQVDDQRVDQLASRGYLSDGHFQVDQILTEWVVGDRVLPIAWTLPATQARLPVVIYLPGLGESRIAGLQWRSAWARAGYAVLAVQLLDRDAELKPRKGMPKEELHALARERYAQEVSYTRLQVLAQLLEMLRREAGSGGDPLLARLDLEHLAVAGYDLGAWSAQLACGEIPRSDWTAPPLPLPITAVLALSPYADFSGKGFATRYRGIRIPFLSITGGADADAAGLVPSAYVRRAPFDNVESSGNSFLLWINDAPHELLSGTVVTDEEMTRAAIGDNPGGDRGSQPAGDRTGSGGTGGSGRRGGNSGRGATSRSALPAVTDPRATMPPEARLSPTDWAFGITLARQASTAFLDAYLKNDPVAGAWLHSEAQAWVGSRGLWKLR